jgi:hypothetical protein
LLKHTQQVAARIEVNGNVVTTSIVGAIGSSGKTPQQNAWGATTNLSGIGRNDLLSLMQNKSHSKNLSRTKDRGTAKQQHNVKWQTEIDVCRAGQRFPMERN